MSVCFLIQLEFLDPGDVASLFQNSSKHASMKEHCWMKKVSHKVLMAMLWPSRAKCCFRICTVVWQSASISHYRVMHSALRSIKNCNSLFYFRYTTSLGPDKVLRSSIVLLLSRWPRIFMNGWTRGTTLTAMDSIACIVLVVYVGECTLGGGLIRCSPWCLSGAVKL
jgi:hypothetical protein